MISSISRFITFLFLLFLNVSVIAKGPDALPTADEYPAIKNQAASGDISAMIQAGICAREGIGRDRNYEDSFSLFSRAADAGDGQAMFFLATAYLTGDGVTKSKDLAFFWAKKSSDTGSAKGKALLAYFFAAGVGTSVSSAEAFRLATEAEKTKDGYARAVLGMCYANGTGTLKDDDAALRLYVLSAETGTRLGLALLGQAHATGKGTPKNMLKAVEFWKMAAAQGHPGAMQDLSLAYYQGEGIDRSYESARTWAELAVERDPKSSVSAAILGLIYREGQGVEKSPSMAARYLRISASAGNINSMNNYAAYCLLPGSGVLADQTLGVALYMVAAAKGEDFSIKNLANVPRLENSDLSYSKASLIARSIMKALDAGYEIEELKEGWSSDKFGKESSDSQRKEDRKGKVVSGSGLVFTQEGHVFTNHHVVENGKSFEVYLPSLKKRLPAKLVVSDAANDLAILHVEGWKAEKHSPASPPPIASSTKAKVGDKVFAMGFPLPGALGTEVKYTSGDVSALSGAEDDKRVIQISAPIQPGNSGGPLALSDGRIVGVIVSSLNFRFALKSSGSLPQNVNFAVKSDYLRILAANSGVDIPDDLKVIGSPVEHVGAFTVQVICTQ